jgi:D-alanine--poly(phosphoribitol) ligase subunit 1
MDLIERIDHWGKVAPEKIAHVSGDRTLTYGALRSRSNALAAYLDAEFPSNRSPIAVLGHREPEMLIAFLGAVKSGRPYIPLDIALPQQRIEKIISTSGAAITLTPELIASVTEKISPPFYNPQRVGSDDPYYILFTSGSTGEPKGVVITLGCLTTFVDWMVAEQKFEQQREVFLNQAPFSFDLSVMDLYCALATGGTLFSISRDLVANPKQLYQALAVSNVTTWVSTPSFAGMCLIEKSFTATMLPLVRRFLFCGETLAPSVAAKLLDRFPNAEVWNTYGPTETTVAVTSVRIDREVLEKHSPLPVGFPTPGVRVFVMDENRQPVAEGERGEIIIAGPNVSTGYLGRTDLTAAAFFEQNGERAYRTGDWGRFRDGLLFFEGRMDGQIKLNGYRIELGDLEANLRALPNVRDVVVIPAMKNGNAQSLAAFTILAERDHDSDFEQSNRLKAQLAQRLPSYMLPRKWIFLDAFPMTANGKADRRKLAEALG